MWISVSGSSVKEEVQKLQAEGMSIAGSRATSANQVRATSFEAAIRCFSEGVWLTHSCFADGPLRQMDAESVHSNCRPARRHGHRCDLIASRAC